MRGNDMEGVRDETETETDRFLNNTHLDKVEADELVTTSKELNTNIINEHTVASMVMQGNHSSLSVQNDTSFEFSESMLDEFDY